MQFPQTILLGGEAGWATYSTITRLSKLTSDNELGDGCDVFDLKCSFRSLRFWQREHPWTLSMVVCAPFVPTGKITRRYKTHSDMMIDHDLLRKIWTV